MNKSKKKSKRISSFAQVNENAAGIDISSKEHMVAVSPDECEDNVRSFGSFTCELQEIVNWLEESGVETIAMESTGVYWIPLFLLLQQRGFEVYLVNARHVKNVSGRKDDETDAAWLQKLHTCGLLRTSFQPDELYRSVRSIVRHRKNLIRDSSKYVNRMQKALEQMNIKLHKVISDITGQTGMQVIEAILSGQTDAQKLADLTDPRIQASREEIVKSLEGYWREEHLFTLDQCYGMFRVLQEKISNCDEKLEQILEQLLAKGDEGHIRPINKKIKRKRSTYKSKVRFHATAYLQAIHEVNVTAIDGINEWTALQLLGELGADMSRWKTHKHFTSWLNLSPNTKISGGKVISSRLKRRKQTAAQVFRMAASTLKNSRSPLGNYYRRMRARLGPAKAVVATARKMAIIYYHMLRSKQEYNPEYLQKASAQHKQNKIQWLEKQLEKLKAA